MPSLKTISLSLLLFISTFGFGQEVLKSEAESADLFGTNVTTQQSGFSGSGYVTGFDEEGDKVTFDFTVSEASDYVVSFGYSSPFGSKKQAIWIDGIEVIEVTFIEASSFNSQYAINHFFSTGNHTVSVVYDWGFINLDYMTLSIPQSVDYDKVGDLVNSNASPEAETMFNRLKESYGDFVIAGHTIVESDVVESEYGKVPALISWDFDKYSPNYAYKWFNGEHTFGPVEDGTVNEIITWYNSSNHCGIPTIQWHWHSPSGGTTGTNTFYTANTTFDISKAIIEGNTEYNEVIRDIDAIAFQLKKLKEAKVPVLWRPLHEAQGSWFWWGVKGAEPVVRLYEIMYDRLTNFHELDNLIWVWSSEGSNYYPGNDLVDIFGYDSYPDPFDYTSKKAVFDNMYQISGGEKILALTENGPLPSIENMQNDNAMWAYFMTWSDFHSTENSNAHMTSTYSSEGVLTMDEVCQITPTFKLTSIDQRLNIFPNPVTDVLFFENSSSSIWEIMDFYGRTLLMGQADFADVRELPQGSYIIRLNNRVSRFRKVD